MGTSRKRMDGPALDGGQGSSGQHGCPRCRCRATEYFREDRVSAATDIIALLHRATYMSVPFSRDHGGDIVRGMETGEFIRCRHRAVYKTVFVEQAESTDEIHYRRYPLDGKGVRRAIP